MDNRQACLAWSLCPGIGPKRLDEIIRVFGDARTAWGKFDDGYGKLNWNKNLVINIREFRKKFLIEKFLETMANLGQDYVVYFDENYPDKLKSIAHAPKVLFIKTKIKDLKMIWNRPWLAVVGTRKITSYGIGVTKMLVGGVVEAGVGIVSGLMYGVDETAHLACMDRGGVTVGVWAGGLDTLNVGSRSGLARRVCESGGVLMSAYPFGVKPSSATFPARNEWVAALGDGVLVVEGSDQSGTLITAGFAAEMGKTVLVVPGPITSGQSSAPNALLKSGATPVVSVEDVLAELPNTLTVKKINTELDSEEKLIVQVLSDGGKSSDEIVRLVKSNVAGVMEKLTILEIAGVVMRSGQEWILRK